MNVFVDGVIPCLRNANWRYDTVTHMFIADEKFLEELNALAIKIGLKRAWLQENSIMPHYDLTPNKREYAIRNGAKHCTKKEFHEAMNYWRVKFGKKPILINYTEEHDKLI